MSNTLATCVWGMSSKDVLISTDSAFVFLDTLDTVGFSGAGVGRAQLELSLDEAKALAASLAAAIEDTEALLATLNTQGNWGPLADEGPVYE